MNSKQLRYSKNKIIKSDAMLRLKFMVCLLAIVGIALLGAFIYNPSLDLLAVLGTLGGGTTYAVMAVVGNVDAVTDRETAGNQIADYIWLLDVHQIDLDTAHPAADANGEIGTIPLKAGEYWHGWEIITNSINDKSTGQKGDITTDMTNTVDFIMGGNKEALKYFIRAHAGGKFLVVYKDVAENKKILLGSLDKPMVLQNFERKNDKEGKYISFAFQNKLFDMQWTYTGNLTTAAPTTIAANATALAVNSNSTYQLTDGTGSAKTIATVSGLAAADLGRVIDIIGSGGSFPSVIADNTVFILTDAGSWTANAGSRISFKIMGTAGNGTLAEVVGSRVQTS